MVKFGVLFLVASILVVALANDLINLKEQEESITNDLQANDVNSLVKSLVKAIKHKQLRDELDYLVKLYDELKKKHKKNNLMRF